MTHDLQTIFGILSVAVGLISYVPYYRDLLLGRTKPHPFSWVGFALLMGIAFFAQVVGGAGPGAWAMGISVVGVLGITILSFSRGEKDITAFDWFCFASALAAIALWQLVGDPLIAVLIVTFADALSFAPTYRKAFYKPREETMSLYVLSAAKHFLSLCALSAINPTTALFPASLVVSNIAFVLLLIIRRRQLRG